MPIATLPTKDGPRIPDINKTKITMTILRTKDKPRIPEVKISEKSEENKERTPTNI